MRTEMQTSTGTRKPEPMSQNWALLVPTPTLFLHLPVTVTRLPELHLGFWHRPRSSNPILGPPMKPNFQVNRDYAPRRETQKTIMERKAEGRDYYSLYRREKARSAIGGRNPFKGAFWIFTDGVASATAILESTQLYVLTTTREALVGRREKFHGLPISFVSILEIWKN